MKGTWKDLFAFNKRERNGIIVLVFIILILLASQLIMPLFVTYPVFATSNKVKAYLAILKEDSIRIAEQRKTDIKKRYAVKSKYDKPEYQNVQNKKKIVKQSLIWDPVGFNPNTASLFIWERFSLSKKQGQSILNYLEKGGEFKVKKDVKKMYVVTEQLYEKMKPFILLPDSVPKMIKYSPKQKIKYTSEVLDIELNQTDTTELKKLKGIGSYYARQIIFYRDKLGGYYSVDQLYEIERMRAETVQKILPFIKVDKSKVMRIKINSTSAADMVKHPYITWNMAIGIQDYRDFTKKFKSTHQLVEIGLLNEEIYSKLVLYLEL